MIISVMRYNLLWAVIQIQIMEPDMLRGRIPRQTICQIVFWGALKSTMGLYVFVIQTKIDLSAMSWWNRNGIQECIFASFDIPDISSVRWYYILLTLSVFHNNWTDFTEEYKKNVHGSALNLKKTYFRQTLPA